MAPPIKIFFAMFFPLLLLLKCLLCLSAFMVLASKNPVHSVLFLIAVFLNGSGLLLLLGLEFLAIIFLVVYVGAIAVLFLFIVMMLNLKIVEFRQSLLNHYPVSLAFLLLLALEISSRFGVYPLASGSPTFFDSPYVAWHSSLGGETNVHTIASLLYTHYYLPFLLSGLVLLVAMVASIALTFSRFRDSPGHRQEIFSQVARANAVRLVPSA